jgi:Tol biopolymer transport system component
VTVTTPPRLPRPDDLRDRSAFEALREQALIEEARRRARRRRQRYAAVALLGVAVAVAVGFGRAGGGRHTSAPAAASGLSQVRTAATNGKIAFDGGAGTLQVVNPDGSGLQVVAHCTVSSCGILEPAWSPDGKRLAFVRGHLGGPNGRSSSSLDVRDSDGGGVRRLAACGSCGEQWGGRLSWSPDGSRIAFSRDSGPGGAQSLWVVAVGNGKLQRLTTCLPRYCVDFAPAWSPSGQLIVFSRTVKRDSSLHTSLYTVHPDGSLLAKVTTVARAADPQWSPDGHQLAFDGNNRIYIADADGSQLKLVLAGAAGSGPGVPSWSPDGTRLAFFNTPGRPGGFAAEVWTMKTDGSARRRLYHSACCVQIWAAPIWSPDGTKIAFAATSAGGTFVINADGSGLRRLSTAYADALAWQRIP